MEMLPLLPLAEDWEPTRATLHQYANAVGVLPRAHAVAHPQWWHVSLEVRPTGLTTDAMPLPGGGTFAVRMDLRSHETVIETSHGDSVAIAMAAGLTGSEFGDRLLSAAGHLGVSGDYAREKFESDEPRLYDRAAAEAFFSAIVNINHNLEIHRSALEGPVSPLQIWPHGFDLAFEWYGTKKETYEEDGEVTEMPAQLNLGFYPSADAYFYSNPWPFAGSELTSQPLPEPAFWHTEDWEGSMLRYDELLQLPNAPERLMEYARAVFAAAAPTLTA